MARPPMSRLATLRMSRWSTCRREPCRVTYWSASGHGASRCRVTKKPSTWPTDSATTSRSSIRQAARQSFRSRSVACRGALWSMIRALVGSSRWRPAILSPLFVLALISTAAAQDAPAPGSPTSPQQHVKIAFVQVDGDPRYAPIRASDRIVLKAPEHPFAGAEVGIDEAAPLVRLLNTDFTLDRIVVKSSVDVAPAVQQAADAGMHFFLIDAPADAYRPLAAAVRGRDVLLFNVSAPDDALRRDLCAAEFVHVYPSRAQLMDGLVQYVVSRKWTNLLELQGPSPADAAMTTAFEHSVQKFGAHIVAQRKFKPGTDPRDREQNDPALLSAISRDFDVAFVADSDFDFARTVPYHLVRPRPVMGSID